MLSRCERKSNKKKMLGGTLSDGCMGYVELVSHFSYNSVSYMGHPDVKCLYNCSFHVELPKKKVGVPSFLLLLFPVCGEPWMEESMQGSPTFLFSFSVLSFLYFFIRAVLGACYM